MKKVYPDARTALAGLLKDDMMIMINRSISREVATIRLIEFTSLTGKPVAWRICS